MNEFLMLKKLMNEHRSCMTYFCTSAQRLDALIKIVRILENEVEISEKDLNELILDIIKVY